MLLGLHTYSLYLHGIGQAWADFSLPWPRQLTTFELFNLAVDLGLDGLHLDDGVLENLDPGYLREVKTAAENHRLYLEYNFSMDMGGMGIGIQHDLDEAIATATTLGADIVKVSMDLKRPRPVSASRFHPEVIEQMKSFATRLKASAPAAQEAGIKIAVENHCDSFSEEILWLLDRVNHPAVGACIDTERASSTRTETSPVVLSLSLRVSPVSRVLQLMARSPLVLAVQLVNDTVSCAPAARLVTVSTSEYPPAIVILTPKVAGLVPQLTTVALGVTTVPESTIPVGARMFRAATSFTPTITLSCFASLVGSMSVASSVEHLTMCVPRGHVE
jgi:hypothetical protein